MAIWTFPLQLDLKTPPANAGEAQRLCAQIEEIILSELEDHDKLEDHGGSVVCLQPIEGVHRHTTTIPE